MPLPVGCPSAQCPITGDEQWHPHYGPGTWLPEPTDDEVLFRLQFLDQYPQLCQFTLYEQASLAHGVLGDYAKMRDKREALAVANAGVTFSPLWALVGVGVGFAAGVLAVVIK